MRNYLFIFIVFFLSCKQKEEKEMQVETSSKDTIILTEDQLQHLTLSTTSLSLQKIDVSQSLSGKVVANAADYVSISAPAGGFVKKINFLPGQRFQKGQILVILEDVSYIQIQEDFLKNKVQLKTNQLTYDRQKELYAQKSTSEKVLQAAESEYQSSLVLHRSLSEKMRFIGLNPETFTSEKITRTVEIRAPFTGIINKVLSNTGKFLSPSEPIFEVINPQGFLLEIKAFERDLPYLKVGQTIEYHTLTQKASSDKARIISIGSMVNEDGTIPIFAQPFQKTDLALGAFVQTLVHTENREVEVLPTTAIQNFENKWYVFIEHQKGTYEMVEVEIGQQDATYTEIKNASRLQSYTIVNKGAYQLLMGLKNTADQE
ncbi:efflux RND transporter periplasmic adaptor subunit [Leadbetterella byssophila]|uniref:efflux RND transporter periplasmic adaptor subunit n=1 Tax=Leadbetterella byssophila TaxID=316068 RepID=UPI0039A03F64